MVTGLKGSLGIYVYMYIYIYIYWVKGSEGSLGTENTYVFTGFPYFLAFFAYPCSTFCIVLLLNMSIHVPKHPKTYSNNWEIIYKCCEAFLTYFRGKSGTPRAKWLVHLGGLFWKVAEIGVPPIGGLFWKVAGAISSRWKSHPKVADSHFGGRCIFPQGYFVATEGRSSLA